ncbi:MULTISPECIES: IS3 family transposase [unclassified Kaistella]|uniref:IS3 family transposase n=1 Tax=unclassified Kaistella TaxID=2762626 RepID=UPI0027364CCE|nr:MULTISPECIES: IS3 family transposase [unclassified Kaistella]MDP2454308.1 IS3 family transposase [Kaistella sp. SH11-4b]MDP2457621.1 IS3 family transposase [Kaistella sp. SH40-3]MDP2461176.1 IS3 family transposase [Kaistella sp. SH19-2b]
MFACNLFGVDRQVYYRKLKKRKVRQSIASAVVCMVLEIRKEHPRMGTRKLYFLLKKNLIDLKIGRDKLINILRANHLLIMPKRAYHITTNSHHRFRKHQNQILDLEIQRPDQVWVSDITYIGKRDNPFYLSLITDAYSKKIVGFNVADNMNTESTLKALQNALKQRVNKEVPLIHHSDRGLQYCANDYQNLLLKKKIKCSMTQNSDPYENAVAERINGILKQEYFIDKFNQTLPITRALVRNAIELYNEKRPHYSNHMLTPNQMHRQNKIKMRTYKRKNTSENVFTSV